MRLSNSWNMKLACVLVGGAWLAAMPLAQAALKMTERSKQKKAAEAESAALHLKLSRLKHEISQTVTAKDAAADTLAESEHAISNANRSLRNLMQEQSQTEITLNGLLKEHAALSSAVNLQQKKLARLLREQYVAGNEDRIKYLLSGDNPNRINRELQYMTYVSQAQAKWIATLRSSLQASQINQSKMQNAQVALKEIVQEKREQKNILENEKSRRAALFSTLSDKLAIQRKEAGNLARDEQRLTRLVKQLAKLIEKQAKAQQSRSKQAGAQSVSNSINADASASSSDNNINIAKFTHLRGQLKLPVHGTLLARYGSKHVDGISWKGIFIRAIEGAEIKSVAGGKVVFADWLRGFGNLMIVDHGSQYLSIYGNNQTLFKRAGDTVKAGDIIASVGNSGGNEQPGLYFELRHQGLAFDPLSWVTATK